MMATDLLAGLRAQDIRVHTDGADLVVDAPEGTLTPDVLARLRTHKPALQALLAGAEPVDWQGMALWRWPGYDLLYRPGERPARCRACAVELVNLRRGDLCGPCRSPKRHRKGSVT